MTKGFNDEHSLGTLMHNWNFPESHPLRENPCWIRHRQLSLQWTWRQPGTTEGSTYQVSEEFSTLDWTDSLAHWLGRPDWPWKTKIHPGCILGLWSQPRAGPDLLQVRQKCIVDGPGPPDCRPGLLVLYRRICLKLFIILNTTDRSEDEVWNGNKTRMDWILLTIFYWYKI